MTRRLPVLLALALCLSSAGCLIPTPKQTRTREGQKLKLDLQFLSVGKTQRSEVLEKLKTVDTGFVSHRYFLGRWSSSRWAWFAVGMPAEAMGGTIWTDANLIVKFDDQGVVQSFEVFPDKKTCEQVIGCGGRQQACLRGQGCPVRGTGGSRGTSASADRSLTGNVALVPLGSRTLSD